jgi:glycosyltransferase involved in cell wall biosynthesis
VDPSLFVPRSGNGSGGQESVPRSRRLLFIGQLVERKGVRMLLEVYRDMLQKSIDAVELVMVGEGPLKGDVERFTRDNKSARVRLCGQVPYGEVGRYYAECDVFVLLSVHDCNPLVLFEALHSGIPIVCSDHAGNARDFVVAGENGYVVDPTNKDQIVGCVMDVLSWSAEKRLSAARTSRQLVEAANYPASAQAFLDACHAILGPHNQGRR